MSEIQRRLRAARKWLRVDPRIGIAAHEFLRHYLIPAGWDRSRVEGRAVDRDGPVPWYTYAAVAFLPRLIEPRMRVFEYGCGGSSLWWGQRVDTVVSVEHDPRWYEEMKPRLGHEVQLVPAGSTRNAHHDAFLAPFFELGLPESSGEGDAEEDRVRGVPSAPFRSYASEILNHPPGHFDVIVVDGMARILTTWLAIRRVAERGFIVFDNSDWAIYREAFRMLDEAGFARIDFWGPGPINAFGWCTSIFLRDPAILRPR